MTDPTSKLIEALESCPFCGNVVELAAVPTASAQIIHHPPYNRRCPLTDKFFVAADWNRRAPKDTPDDVSAGVAWDQNYRRLDEGEVILATDECQRDDGSWIRSVCVGERAPDPNYTSHRVYRRKLSAALAQSPTPLAHSEEREAIARIVDPVQWCNHDAYLRAMQSAINDRSCAQSTVDRIAGDRVAPSLAKADAILALRTPNPAVDEHG